jgi:hypothetical protein
VQDDSRPSILEEVLALGGAQPLGSAGRDEHADAALDHDEPLLLEGLVGLGDGERIGAEIGGEAAHRRQRIAVADAAFEDHRRDAVAQAEIDGAFFVHSVMLS